VANVKNVAPKVIRGGIREVNRRWSSPPCSRARSTDRWSTFGLEAEL